MKNANMDIEVPTLLKSSFGMIPLNDIEFRSIRKLVYDHFGINLTEQKRSLVIGRLQKYLKTNKFKSFHEYCEHLRSDTTGQALGELVNRISTNHTFFFREKDHFDFFSQVVLPEASERLKKDCSKDLRIWCAGCSYGDEPYSLAISMMEYFGAEYNLWDAGVLATDISAIALAGARAGIYNEDRVKLVSQNFRQKYFIKLPDGSLRVSDHLKKEITFRRLNLMNPQIPLKRPFDLISCRNVMIYFDQPTRKALINRFYNLTVPGGYLYIGHSETMRKSDSPYENVKPAIYRKGGI